MFGKDSEFAAFWVRVLGQCWQLVRRREGSLYRSPISRRWLGLLGRELDLAASGCYSLACGSHWCVGLALLSISIAKRSNENNSQQKRKALLR
jgi:hypothetical protein